MPRESAAGSYDCTIYTGTLAVYGNDLHVSLLNTMLENLLQELPAAAKKLPNLGATRLEASEAFSKLIHVPNNSKVRGRSVILSAGSKVGLAFLVLTILAGIAVLARFIRIENENQQQQHMVMMLSKQQHYVTNKVVPAAGRRWNLFRVYYRHVNDCDATQTSSVCSGSRSEKSRSQKKKTRVGRKKRTMRSSMEVGRLAMLSVHCEEPDSIYIVEPDDDDDIYICNSEYGADPLSWAGLETF